MSITPFPGSQSSTSTHCVAGTRSRTVAGGFTSTTGAPPASRAEIQRNTTEFSGKSRPSARSPGKMSGTASGSYDRTHIDATFEGKPSTTIAPFGLAAEEPTIGTRMRPTSTAPPDARSGLQRNPVAVGPMAP